MRSLTITMALLATTLTSTQAISQNIGSNYSVELNKTQIIRLPKAAGAILIGQPDIADISVHSVDTMFVVGRGYGQTNLIVLDADGNTLVETDINVVHTLPHEGVRVYNAKNRETFSCIPFCQPSPVLGDDPNFIGRNTNAEPQLSPLAALFQDLADQEAESNQSVSGVSSGNDLVGGNDSNDGLGSGF